MCGDPRLPPAGPRIQFLDERSSSTARDSIIQKKLRELDHLAVAGFDHGSPRLGADLRPERNLVMKFTAYVATNASGSKCETEFEVDDDVLAKLSKDGREEHLHEQAVDVLFESGLVHVWHEEIDE